MLNKKNVLLSLCLLLSISTTTFASTLPTTKRLAGDNRYATSIAISNGGWQQSDYVILATGENYPDALAATPLAKNLRCPILLTEKDKLVEPLHTELTRLEVKQVFILGGTGVISQNIENQLQGDGITVTRISGATRYETAVKIAQQLNEYTQYNEVIVVTGEDYSDALSIASIAGTKYIPILLVTNYTVPSSVKNFLHEQNISKTYVIGDGSIGSIQVASQLPNAEKITGNSKYDRNIAVINRFRKDLNFDTIFVGTGDTFPDSLSGSALAVQTSNPIVLVNDSNTSLQKNLIKDNKIDTITLLGGIGAISEELSSNLIEESSPEDENKSELEVVETHWEDRFLCGSIKNNSRDLFKYVRIDLNLYDANGDQVGTEMQTTIHLESGRQWKFRVEVYQKEVSDYKIMKVSGKKE